MPNYKTIKDYLDKAEKARMVDKILLLRADLDAEIPKKTESRTLLLATWNIREFHAVADATQVVEFVVPWVETHGYNHGTANAVKSEN